MGHKNITQPVFIKILSFSFLNNSFDICARKDLEQIIAEMGSRLSHQKLTLENIKAAEKADMDEKIGLQIIHELDFPKLEEL